MQSLRRLKAWLRCRFTTGPQQSCPDSEQLAAFYDGQLGATVRRRLKHHIQQCPRCRRDISQLLAEDIDERR